MVLNIFTLLLSERSPSSKRIPSENVTDHTPGYKPSPQFDWTSPWATTTQAKASLDNAGSTPYVRGYVPVFKENAARFDTIAQPSSLHQTNNKRILPPPASVLSHLRQKRRLEESAAGNSAGDSSVSKKLSVEGRSVTATASALVAKRILESMSDIVTPLDDQRRKPTIRFANDFVGNEKQDGHQERTKQKDGTELSGHRERFQFQTNRYGKSEELLDDDFTVQSKDSRYSEDNTKKRERSEGFSTEEKKRTVSFAPETPKGSEELKVSKGKYGLDDDVEHVSKKPSTPFKIDNGNTSKSINGEDEKEFQFGPPTIVAGISDMDMDAPVLKAQGKDGVRFVFSPPRIRQRKSAKNAKESNYGTPTPSLSASFPSPFNQQPSSFHIGQNGKETASISKVEEKHKVSNGIAFPSPLAQSSSAIDNLSTPNTAKDVKSGFADSIWKQQLNKVKCQVCLVLNEKNVTKCVACENPMGTPATMGGIPTDGVSNEIAKPSKTPNFALVPSAPTAPGSIGSGGFSFGVTSAATTSNTAPSSVVSFQPFGAPESDSKQTITSTIGFSSVAKIEPPPPIPMFSAPKINFGIPAETPPSITPSNNESSKDPSSSSTRNVINFGFPAAGSSSDATKPVQSFKPSSGSDDAVLTKDIFSTSSISAKDATIPPIPWKSTSTLPPLGNTLQTGSTVMFGSTAPVTTSAPGKLDWSLPIAPSSSTPSFTSVKDSSGSIIEPQTDNKMPKTTTFSGFGQGSTAASISFGAFSSQTPSATTSSAPPTITTTDNGKQTSDSAISSTATAASSAADGVVPPPVFKFGSSSSTLPATSLPSFGMPSSNGISSSTSSTNASFGSTSSNSTFVFGSQPVSTASSSTSSFSASNPFQSGPNASFGSSGAVPAVFGQQRPSSPGVTMLASQSAESPGSTMDTGAGDASNSSLRPSTVTPIFGSTSGTSTTTSNAIGSSKPGIAFGQLSGPVSFATSTTTSFGSTPTSAFGSSGSSFGTSLPGPTFGATSNPTSTFGASGSTFGAGTSSSAFGAGTSASGGFGSTTAAFGSTAAPTGGFGAPGAGFGSSASATSAFGSTGSAFGSTSTSTTGQVFGTAATTANTGFSSSGSGFGISPATSTLSTAAPTSTGFGAGATSFGTTSVATTTFGSTGASFGSSVAGTSFGAPAFGSSGSAFGATANTTGFGASASTPKPAFGSSGSTFGLSTPATTFGNTSGVASGGFGTATSTTFGTSSAAGPGFGSTPSQSSGFGTSGFGSQQQPTGSAFGATPSQNPFASTGSSQISQGHGAPSFNFPGGNAAPATGFSFGASSQPAFGSVGQATFGAGSMQGPPMGSAPSIGGESAFSIGASDKNAIRGRRKLKVKR